VAIQNHRCLSGHKYKFKRLDPNIQLVLLDPSPQQDYNNSNPQQVLLDPSPQQDYNN